MGRARDISKVFSTGTALATDSEISAFNYLTQSSASTVYQTKAAAGLTLLTPASIANIGGTASIGANGTVSFTSASAISLNDVFSATYESYRLVFNYSGTINTTARLKFRVAGADNSTNNYYTQTATLSAASVTASLDGATTTGILIGNHVGAPMLSSYDLGNVFATQKTQIIGMRAVDSNCELKNGVFDATTSFTGFTIIPTSGTMTGNVSVYGYNK
jgi:hypothetical protein